jgi:hypothetical protein
VEALVLAAALRVIRPAVQHANAELEQPDAEPGPALAGCVAPWRAVVDKERLRQSVVAEHPLQALLHRGGLLVAAGLQPHRIARMVIHNGQRMTASAARQRDVALEVHLPKQVGRGLLEPLMGDAAATRRDDPAVPTQDVMHRRGHRADRLIALQTAHDLRAPQAGWASRTATTCCSIVAAVRPGLVCGRRDRSANPSWQAARASHRYAVFGWIPNRRHNSRRFAPSIIASLTNSRRASIFDTSVHGMDGLPERQIHARMCR